jgi:hypothetical protein
MPCHRWLAPLAFVIALALPRTDGRPADDPKYPDWQGQWGRVGDARWDISKPRLKQEAPLTPEYQKFLEASIAEQAAGGHGNDLMYKCLPPGMPRTMLAYYPLQFIVQPDITYVVLEHMNQRRRIYTDGRAWPEKLSPAFVGYSIGTWVDEDHDGRYDALMVETRGLKGPRAFDSSGLPLHSDNQTVVKERIFLDPAEKDLLHDQITTIDHALTRPWTVTRSFRREPHPVWVEHVCAEDNHHYEIGGENYFLSVDGYLMPTRKDQAPPDLRNFGPAQR